MATPQMGPLSLLTPLKWSSYHSSVYAIFLSYENIAQSPFRIRWGKKEVKPLFAHGGFIISTYCNKATFAVRKNLVICIGLWQSVRLPSICEYPITALDNEAKRGNPLSL
jgi:hypothetical protein